MRAENAWIQTAGYAFRRADGEILGDFGAEFSKTKTLGAGVRIFNGAVRTEREFPLKILFLACIQGLVFYIFCGTEIKISPAALRIRFLFTLYQSIFEPLFSHMLQTNSKLNVAFSLLSCYHIHEAFTFLTVQITAASAVSNDYILICLSKEISMLYSLSYSAARFLRHAASCGIHLNKEAMKWKEKQTGFISHVSS